MVPAGGVPEVDRVKSNAGLRPASRPWLLAAGGAAALALVALAALAAARAGRTPAGGSPGRRAEVVVGHRPEHVRTQAPAPAPGAERSAGAGGAPGSPPLVPPADPVRGLGARAGEASSGPRPAGVRVTVGHPPEHPRPAGVTATVGHPPEHTQTLPPGASAAVPPAPARRRLGAASGGQWASPLAGAR